MQSAFTSTAIISPITITMRWLLRLYHPDARSIELLNQSSILRCSFAGSAPELRWNESSAPFTLGGRLAVVLLRSISASAKFFEGIYDGSLLLLQNIHHLVGL